MKESFSVASPYRPRLLGGLITGIIAAVDVDPEWVQHSDAVLRQGPLTSSRLLDPKIEVGRERIDADRGGGDSSNTPHG